MSLDFKNRHKILKNYLHSVMEKQTCVQLLVSKKKEKKQKFCKYVRVCT